MGLITELLEAQEPDRHTRVRTPRSVAPPGRSAPKLVTGLLWASDLAITTAVLVVLFVFWQMAWSNVQSDREQDRATQALEQRWSRMDTDSASGGANAVPGADARGVPVGDGIARLLMPRFGDWSRTVVQGVTQKALAVGPGHYPGSQAPGQQGNFAIAGHRDGQGAPFHDLDKLETCDPIVVETADRWLVYRVLPVERGTASGADAEKAKDEYVSQAMKCVGWSEAGRLSSDYLSLAGRQIVTPDRVDVVAPVPGRAQLSEGEAALPLITLTTCHPIWSNEQRLVIHGVLSNTYMKKGQEKGFRPPQLNEFEKKG